MSEDDKKEGLLKRLKNIEDKNERQLDTNSKSLKSISYFNQLSTEAKELFEKIKKEINNIDSENFVCVKTDGTIFNFNKFKIHWIWLQIFIETRIYLKMRKMNKTK